MSVARLAVNGVVGVWLRQAPYLLELPARAPMLALVGGFFGSEIGVVSRSGGLIFLLGLGLGSTRGARSLLATQRG